MKQPLALLRESIDHLRNFSEIYLGYSAWILIPTLGMVLVDVLPDSLFAQLVGIFLVLVGTSAIIWISVILIHLAAKLETTDIIDHTTIQRQAVRQILPLLLVAFLQLLFFIGGLLLLVVPALLFAIWYSFSQVSVVLEEKRGLEALAYSKTLVKGRFWYVALGMAGVPMLVALGFAMVTGALALGIAFATGQDVITLLNAEQEPVWITAIHTIGQIILIPLMSIYTTKFYLHIKETSTPSSLDKAPQIG